MPDITVTRDFSYVRTSLDSGPVDDVYYGGKPPLDGGGANGIPKGQLIGRIQNRVTEGVWYATPDGGDWHDLRWFGPFYSRREASMFLVGMLNGALFLCS